MGSCTITSVTNLSVTGVEAEARVNGTDVIVNFGASVEVTGVSATTSMGQVLVWGLVVPNQTPNFITITPNQTPNFNTIGGATAPPLQVPSWVDIAA